jgi:hypothetical protein
VCPTNLIYVNYVQKACRILFVAFILPAIAVCVESVRLYAVYEDPYHQTLFIDSLRLDLVVHTSLALSFFILLSCIKIVYQAEGHSRVFVYMILLACFLFVVFVLLFIASLIYTLIDSILSSETVLVVSSSSTCLGDFCNLVACLLIIIVIREKNRSYVKSIIDNSRYLSCWYSYCFEDTHYARGKP